MALHSRSVSRVLLSMSAEQPWICMDCGRLHPEPGRCAGCGSDPLLDVRDPEIRRGLIDDDERTAAARDRLMIGLAIPLTLVIAAILVVIDATRMLLALVPGGAIGHVLLAAGLCFGLSRVLLRMFPPVQRFTTLRDD